MSLSFREHIEVSCDDFSVGRVELGVPYQPGGGIGCSRPQRIDRLLAALMTSGDSIVTLRLCCVATARGWDVVGVLRDELRVRLLVGESREPILNTAALDQVRALLTGSASLPEGWCRHEAAPDGSSRPLWETTTTAVDFDQRQCRAWLSGAFHPLHAGHRQLRSVAEEELGVPVGYELTVRNADKPPIDPLTLHARRQQFSSERVALTNAGTFLEKAHVLGSVAFVVGYDTAVRILDPRFYGDSTAARDRALSEFRDIGVSFAVAGRLTNGRFCMELPGVPVAYRSLFRLLPESRFRCDLSSTDLRESGQSVWDRLIVPDDSTPGEGQ